LVRLVARYLRGYRLPILSYYYLRCWSS